MIDILFANAGNSVIRISLPQLLISLLPIVFVGWISFRWVGKGAGIGVATARMLVQLFAVGYVLVFLFDFESPWVAVGVVVFMIAVSAWIAIRTIRGRRWRAYGDALLAVGVGGGIILALVIWGVIGLEPWYQLRYVITLAGMIFSNAMTAVTLSAERFDAEIESGKEPVAARSTAWNAALIPQVNSFLAVGLVSLPGMMTGQILSGVDPLVAVRYQIVVMSMVMGSAGLAVAIFLGRQLRFEMEAVK